MVALFFSRVFLFRKIDQTRRKEEVQLFDLFIDRDALWIEAATGYKNAFTKMPNARP